MQYRFIDDHQGRYSLSELCECFGQCPESFALSIEVAQEGFVIVVVLWFSVDLLWRREGVARPEPEQRLSGLFVRLLALLIKLLEAVHNQLWVADTTYLKVQHGWCYLATVMDLYSRRIVGWKVSVHNDSKLVCQALQCAVLTRGGKLPKGLIHHSDRGSTYASYDYEAKLRSFGIEQSMSAKGNCYDNAAQESFYGRYKTSTVGSKVFFDEAAAKSNAFEYIEVFYNRFRKHSCLGYKSPLEFEENARPHGGMGTSLSACINHN